MKTLKPDENKWRSLLPKDITAAQQQYKKSAKGGIEWK